MTGQTKYAVMGAFGAAMLVSGTLLFAAVVSDDDGGNTFGKAFGGALGISLAITGIGICMAAVATLPARRD